MAFKLHKTQAPPPFVPQGFQNDGAGPVYLAVAHTQWGDIPGKALPGTCWFPYGGTEHATNNFSFVEVQNSVFIKSPHAPPATAVIAGFQNDGAGPLYAVIAHTQWGNIPGKGKPGTAWFAYGGKEHSTADFSWIAQTFSLLHVSQSPAPPATNPTGFQNDGAGVVHSVICHTAHGDIPGKAKGGEAWYPYGGAEHSTRTFSWLNVPGAALVQGPQPPHAIPAGFQNDGAGKLYPIIAQTQWGTIPGKGLGTTAWFSYGGKEHTTHQFSWIVHP